MDQSQAFKSNGFPAGNPGPLPVCTPAWGAKGWPHVRRRRHDTGRNPVILSVLALHAMISGVPVWMLTATDHASASCDYQPADFNHHFCDRIIYQPGKVFNLHSMWSFTAAWCWEPDGQIMIPNNTGTTLGDTHHQSVFTTSFI